MEMLTEKNEKLDMSMDFSFAFLLIYVAPSCLLFRAKCTCVGVAHFKPVISSWEFAREDHIRRANHLVCGGFCGPSRDAVLRGICLTCIFYGPAITSRRCFVP